jgi:hypothetical protein
MTKADAINWPVKGLILAGELIFPVAALGMQAEYFTRLVAEQKTTQLVHEDRIHE